MRQRPWSGYNILSTMAVLVGLLAFQGTASAHGVDSSGFEAPLPLWLLYTGAGATVALTAGWLAIGEHGPVDKSDIEISDTAQYQTVIGYSVAESLRFLGRSVGLVGLGLVIFVGLIGPQVQSDNVATVLFWPVWMKGLGLFAILAGSPWRVVSPWQTLYQGLTQLEGEPIALLDGYPDRLAHWPALVGFVILVGIAENLTTLPRSPRLTATAVAGYALVMLVGGLAVGPRWFRQADPLSVIYRLFSRVAPIAIEQANGGYRLSLRPPWRGCIQPVADRSLVAFAIAAVYTVSFDGMTNIRTFQAVLNGLSIFGSPTGIAIGLYVIGFVLFVISYWLAIRVVGMLGGSPADDNLTQAFAGSVLPIAAAYELAHTYPFVFQNAGRLVETGTVGHITPAFLAWLPVTGFWASQVFLIIVGHVVAVIAAHAIATERYGLQRGRRAHLPLVIVMVGYTVLSLWIISQPVVA